MSIVAQLLTYEHPDRETLFHDLSISIQKGQRASLIGNNGLGKSTLLQILAGKLELKSGSVYTDSDPYYVPQHFGQYDGMTLASALRVDAKISALQAILAGDASTENFDLLGEDWEIEERVKLALIEWGVDHLGLDKQMSEISGGEKTKIFLAGITMHKPAIILLDEPTNHLDYASREKLYKFIESSTATILVVSHDRTLLNLLPHTYEMSTLGIKYYAGNYDLYQEQKEAETSALVSQLESKEKELRFAKKTKQEVVEKRQKLDARGKAKGEKMGLGGIAMRMRKDRAERTTNKLKDTHHSKIEDVADDISDIQKNIDLSKTMKMIFRSPALHEGKILANAQGMNYKYADKNLWEEALNFKIRSGERVQLMGANGSGKTTLLKLLTDKLLPAEGTLDCADFSYVYLDQEYSLVNSELTVYEQAQQFNLQMPEHEVKMNLSRSLFPSHTWDKPCSQLSGGEKMKLVLCCLIISTLAPDMIILDEPTNNIDIKNIEILTNSIANYEGTIILVSHDKHFIEQVGIDYAISL